MEPTDYPTTDRRTCPWCGSDDVDQLRWVHANTGQVRARHENVPEGDGEFWCHGCATSLDFVDDADARRRRQDEQRERKAK